MGVGFKFTVAIPTYNGESRLPELLRRLENQQLDTESFSWEIIVVDNNSTDNTAQLIQNFQATWQHPYPLKYYFEVKQGAAYARSRAIAESQSELIGFLDDDNYPEPNWVVEAYKFAQKYPQAGAYASQVHANWEIEPPENFHRIAPFLAITERGDVPLLYKPWQKLLPPSAGLVIRRKAWLESVPEQPILTGRVTGNTLTSEDLEMLSYIQKNGWEIWYNPEMEIYHQIPASRLNKEYLIPFFRGIGLSRHVTRMVNVKSSYRPLIILAYLVSDSVKIIQHLLKYGYKLSTDLVAACEMQLLLAKLYSPFYLWKKGYLKGKL